MKNIQFEVISEMYSSMFGVHFKMETVRYNIGLNTDQIHHSLIVVGKNGNPTGVEIHKDGPGDMWKFFNSIHSNPNEKFSEQGMGLLEKALNVFIKNQKRIEEGGIQFKEKVTINKECSTEVLGRKVSMEQIEISFGRSVYKNNVMTVYGMNDHVDFEIHDGRYYGDPTFLSRNKVDRNEIDLLIGILGMFVSGNDFIKDEEGYW